MLVKRNVFEVTRTTTPVIAIKEWNNICLKNKCELIFVFLPTRQDLLRQKKSFLFKKDLFEIADQLGIRYIDIEIIILEIDLNRQ